MHTTPIKTKTVMIVDDSPSIRKVVDIALRAEGFETMAAQDGTDALEQLQNSSDVAAILCDMNMPGLDGLGFVGRLRLNDEHRFTPVIMLTTEAAEEHIQRARAVGVSGWIEKPFDADQLLGTVRRIVA